MSGDETDEGRGGGDGRAEDSSLVPRTSPLLVNVITIFPGFFAGPLSLSIPARGAAAGAVRYNVVDLRDYTHDRHRTVDDYPYGGGAGMVMKPGPFFEAAEAIGARAPIVLLSPRGRRFTHAHAVRYGTSTDARPSPTSSMSPCGSS